MAMRCWAPLRHRPPLCCPCTPHRCARSHLHILQHDARISAWECYAAIVAGAGTGAWTWENSLELPKGPRLYLHDGSQQRLKGGPGAGDAAANAPGFFPGCAAEAARGGRPRSTLSSALLQSGRKPVTAGITKKVAGAMYASSLWLAVLFPGSFPACPW